MAAICARFNYKLLSFSTKWAQIHDFGVYSGVFRYVRTSGVAAKYFRHRIINKIQDRRYAFVPSKNEKYFQNNGSRFVILLSNIKDFRLHAYVQSVAKIILASLRY